MKEIIVKAPAKINLYLAVSGKRKDGFHNIETIMQTVNLCDELRLKERKGGIKLVTSHPQISKGTDNIVYKAACLFFKKTGLKKGVSIELKKNIPVGAGLGGGSSDAASVLKGLNRLWKLKIANDQLKDWAKELGSDVPFFIEGKTAWVSGRGEKVKPLETKKSFNFLLFFPGIPLSTAKVYKAFRGGKRRGTVKIRTVITALKNGNWELLASSMHNSLEKTVFKVMPELSTYRKKLVQAGFSPVRVCGSGSTLFAPIKKIRKAEVFGKKFNLREEVYIVRSLSVLRVKG